MRKFLAWLLLLSMLGFGGYRIWDRNTQPPTPVTIEQVQPTPEVLPAPPAAPEHEWGPSGAPPVAKKPPRRKPAAVPLPPEPPKGGGKVRPKGKSAPVPAATPARPPQTRPIHVYVDGQFPRGADSGASTLPVSCATIRWYANNAPSVGAALAAKYHPTAAQLAAAKACLKG